MAEAPPPRAPGPDPDGEFFVGYLPTPPGVRRFAFLAVPLVLVLAALGAWATASAMRSPAPGAQRGAKVALAGLYLASPYGMLRYLDPDDPEEVRHAVVVEGYKAGPRRSAAALDGELVRIGGRLLRRDDRGLLTLAGGAGGLAPLAEITADAEPDLVQPDAKAEARLREVPTERLGEVTLAGEIVDSKCYYGAMRPGEGRGHRPCAQYCVRGRVPPILVTRHPAHGRHHFLLVDADGGPMFEASLPYLAVPVDVTGALERTADLYVLRATSIRPR